MSQQKRSRLSPTQKADIWRRWKAGQSLHDIGRAYGKPHCSIRCVLLPPGGIPPTARRRSRLRGRERNRVTWHQRSQVPK
jgi:predicted Zn-dependent protease